MQIRPTTLDDIVTYSAFGRKAQAWLRGRGLEQFVPAAHEEYDGWIRARVEAKTLFAVVDGAETIGFFSLEPTPSPWWPHDETRAMYLAGMVVARTARGRGAGRLIIQWCVAEAARRACQYVRLDCHAGNAWLCAYYEAHGFKLQRKVEQHPGYEGCLYQREVTDEQRVS